MKDKSQEAREDLSFIGWMKDKSKEGGGGFVLKMRDEGQIARSDRKICP
jgi:hypothetical protein